MGIFKPSNTSQSTPKLPSLTSLGQALHPPLDSKSTTHSPKVEPDSSSKKQDYKSSPKGYKCPVSAAAGSHTDLGKSEHEHETAHASNSTERLMPSTGEEREVGSMKTTIVPKAEVCTMDAATGYEHGQAFKHGRSIDPGSPSECPHLKEH